LTEAYLLLHRYKGWITYFFYRPVLSPTYIGFEASLQICNGGYEGNVVDVFVMNLIHIFTSGNVVKDSPTRTSKKPWRQHFKVQERLPFRESFAILETAGGSFFFVPGLVDNISELGQFPAGSY